MKTVLAFPLKTSFPDNHLVGSEFGRWFRVFLLCYRWEATLNSAVEECKEKGLKCGKSVFIFQVAIA